MQKNEPRPQSAPEPAPAERRPLAALPLVGVCAALVFSITLIAVGWIMGGLGMALVAAGALGVVLTTLHGPRLLAGNEPDRSGEGLRADVRALQQALTRLSEQSTLSGDARRVLNRKGERDLLRKAIQEDMAAEDWDAALVLVKELADRFGYRADAEEFRQKIEQARFDTQQRKVTEAIAHLDGLIAQRRWDQALAEAARIGRLFPDSPRVDGLRHRVETARFLYKEDLERRFLHASRDGSPDEALELLKELDAYLSEREAEPLREVARGVIGKARENLGVQFKLAIQDQRWRDAVDVGERIADDFPNSRMAEEVRSVLPSLRARATGVTPRIAS